MARLLPRLILVLAAAAAGSALVAAGAPAAVKGASSAARDGHESATAVAARHRRRRRPGCGSFCRQAGGFGAGPDTGPPAVLIPSQRVRVARDAIVTVKATCQLDETCDGAILIDSFHTSYGRADLRIPAHATRKVEVGVTSAGMRYLRKHRKDRTAFATVPLKDENIPVSTSKRLTLLAPR